METFKAEIWRWEARSDGWYFVSLPEELSDDLDAQVMGLTAGFGSIPVNVRIGRTTWRTSVFPDRARGTFVLPLKKAVRAAEGLHEGDLVDVAIAIRANP